jgi:site-specific recombinase XerD
VQALIGATKGSRNDSRDRCLLVLMFRQGLRVSEACGLKLDQEPKNIGQAESAVVLAGTNDRIPVLSPNASSPSVDRRVSARRRHLK